MLAGSTLFLEITKGFGDTSCRGSPFGSPGEAIDIGVLGGSGIGCRGALGDRGTAPANAIMLRGDKGGEFREE